MIKRCETCEGVVREQALDASMTFEQVKFHIRELIHLGVPPGPLGPIRTWAKTLQRCSCTLDQDFKI